MAKVAKQPDGSLVIQYTKKEREQMTEAEQVRSMLVKALLSTMTKEVGL